MPRLDLASLPATNASGYPEPYRQPLAGRWYRRLGPAAGLAHLAASHCTLEPGAWSSQRHWHRGEDEIVIMLAGEAVLVEDDTRTTLRAGDIATFAGDSENGHHMINEGDAPCSFVAISAGPNNGGVYPDIDMIWDAEDRNRHKDGTLYPGE